MRLAYIPHLLRELIGKQTLVRTAEPMLMTGEEQIKEYTDYGRGDTSQFAGYLFHAHKMSQVIKNCKTVVDLGCGPASQLMLVAQLNPHISFIGIDLSQEMLNAAAKTAESQGIKNLSFIKDDITKLSLIQDHSVDGVISSMALHHLPTDDDLKNCYSSISRILKETSSAIYLVDFGLLKSRKTVEYMVSLSPNMAKVLEEDYRNSLLAAFPLKTIKSLAHQFTPQAKVISTYGLDFFSVVKTQSFTLAPEQTRLLNEKLETLSNINLKLYQDLGLFLGI